MFEIKKDSAKSISDGLQVFGFIAMDWFSIADNLSQFMYLWDLSGEWPIGVLKTSNMTKL